MQKEREERVRKIREQQEDERKKKVEELKNHVSFFSFLHIFWLKFFEVEYGLSKCLAIQVWSIFTLYYTR